MLARHTAFITPRIASCSDIALRHGELAPGHRSRGVRSRGCRTARVRSQDSETLKQHALGVRDIRLVVLTHAHGDHAGSAALLRRLSGAPIVAHENDAQHYSRAVPMSFCPTGWFGRLFLKTPLMRAPCEGFAPDILLSNTDTLDLRPYGLRGIVGRRRATPPARSRSNSRRRRPWSAISSHRDSAGWPSSNQPRHTSAVRG